MSLAYTYITAVDTGNGEITLADMPGNAATVTTLYVYPVSAAIFLQGADSDTLETLSDQLDTVTAATAACASIAANSSDATAAGAITRKRGNSWSISLTLGSIVGYTSLWFTVKRSYDDADSAALLHVKLNSPSAADGLLYVNGAAATNAALGSITVSDATTGAIVIAVDETITDDLAPGTYYYDAQALITGAVSTPDSGTFTVTADVTRSVA